jgi:hypothetical protein
MSMRAYFFGNMYLSSIQQGIQAAHVVADMFVKYPYHDPEAEILRAWATDHKTMVLLNGGYSETIRDLVEFLDTCRNPLPWASFNEGVDALDGALTDVGIIIPEKIYQMAAAIRSQRSVHAGERFISDVIREEGMITVYPENKLGFNVTEDTVLSYTKFEYDLMLRLNEFGLAK